ncbi:MAG: hypothetical protein RXO22_01090 [Thermocladium sp.]
MLRIEVRPSDDGVNIIYANNERIGVKIGDLIEIDIVNEWSYPITTELEINDHGKMLYCREPINGREVELVGYEGKSRRELIAVRTRCDCDDDELKNLVENILLTYEGKSLLNYLETKQLTPSPAGQ